MEHIGLVCTTIGDGKFLEGYCKKAEEEGLKDSVTFYIIADLKTPKSLYEECARQECFGFDIRYHYVDEQVVYLKKLNMQAIVPYNSDNRRNIGYLMALEDDCDVIISIDDDNYCREGSFFKEHSVVGCKASEKARENKWYNVCRELNLGIYPRGYSYKNRKDNTYPVVTNNDANGYVAVNAGLWLHDPDLDALTWLSFVATPEYEYSGESYFLGDNTWAPINSQNTAVVRDTMVANYFIPMGNVINGMRIDHHADIFTGYFLRTCVKHMGHKVRFGTPVVDHIRNNHDYMADLVNEYACIQMLEDLTEWLPEVKLDGKTYSEAYESLSHQLEDVAETFKGKIWTVDAKSFIHRTAYCMRKWIAACEMLGI